MLNSRRRWAKKKKEWSPAGEASLQERPAKRQSICIEDKPDSPEGADTAASELQKLSLVKKEGDGRWWRCRRCRWKILQTLQQLSMKNPLNHSPLTALTQSKPWGAFCQTNQWNQWNFQEKMERHFSVETKFHFESSDPFTFLPKFDYCLAK